MKRITKLCLYLAITVLAAMFAGCGDDDNGFFFIPVTGLSISPTTMPNGTVGVAYSQAMTTSGGTPSYTWSISAGTLPAGLTLAPATGVISGTPTAAGTSTFTVTVTDSATPPLTGSRTYTITIQPSAALTITTTSLPAATVGVAYSQTLAATGGTPPYGWSISAGALPAGLVLDGPTGVISGTPTTAETANFTVMVTDSSVPVAATATQALSITVSAAGGALTITTTTLPDAAFGTAYSQTLVATGGTPPYSWSISAGALPTGITLSAAGVLSGTPLVSGAFNFTVTVTDAVTATATQPLALTVTISAPVLSGKTIYDGQCAGCHSLTGYEGGGITLSGVPLANFTARFGGGATHQGQTLTATQITDVFAFTSLFP